MDLVICDWCFNRDKSVTEAVAILPETILERNNQPIRSIGMCDACLKIHFPDWTLGRTRKTAKPFSQSSVKLNRKHGPIVAAVERKFVQPDGVKFFTKRQVVDQFSLPHWAIYDKKLNVARVGSFHGHAVVNIQHPLIKKLIEEYKPRAIEEPKKKGA